MGEARKHESEKQREREILKCEIDGCEREKMKDRAKVDAEGWEVYFLRKTCHLHGAMDGKNTGGEF